jgi:hypothetical protein
MSMPTISFRRLHVDAAGESHMQSGEVVLERAEFAPPAQPMEVSPLEPAVGWRYLHLPPQWVGEWHPTPKRIWIFCLRGQMEFKASDGAAHHLEPGSTMLLEDTSGRGHHSRVLGHSDVLLVAVQL